MGARDRAAAGRPIRLTHQVQEDIISGVRTGAPVHWCAEFVGVSRGELRRWRREADAAIYKPQRQWTDLERRCVAFFAALRQAEADAGMRLHMALASSAGLTRERPKRRRTVQRVVADGAAELSVNEHGQVAGGRVVEVQVIEEELAPNFQAMKVLGATRFPEEMGAAADEEGWGDTPPALVADEVLMRALEAAGRRAGLAPAEEIVDADVVEDESHEEEPAAR